MAAEDAFYSRAIALCDEAVLALNSAVEDGSLAEDAFYFLSYLLARPALSLKDRAVNEISRLFTLFGAQHTVPIRILCKLSRVDRSTEGRDSDLLVPVLGRALHHHAHPPLQPALGTEILLRILLSHH